VHSKPPRGSPGGTTPFPSELAELAGTGELDLTEFRAAKGTNARAMQALRETLAKSAEDEAMQRTRAEAADLRAKWDDLGIDRRRVVQGLAERIEVGPAVRGRNFYVPERVRLRTASYLEGSEPPSEGTVR